MVWRFYWKVGMEKQVGSLQTWTFGCTVCDPGRGKSYLVGLVNIIVGQGAQKVLQAWDVVIIDGMDDGFHHEGVFFILRESEDVKG